jgi:hypothetical protein
VVHTPNAYQAWGINCGLPSVAPGQPTVDFVLGHYARSGAWCFNTLGDDSDVKVAQNFLSTRVQSKVEQVAGTVVNTTAPSTWYEVSDMAYQSIFPTTVSSGVTAVTMGRCSNYDGSAIPGIPFVRHSDIVVSGTFSNVGAGTITGLGYVNCVQAWIKYSDVSGAVITAYKNPTANEVHFTPSQSFVGDLDPAMGAPTLNFVFQYVELGGSPCRILGWGFTAYTAIGGSNVQVHETDCIMSINEESEPWTLSQIGTSNDTVPLTGTVMEWHSIPNINQMDTVWSSYRTTSASAWWANTSPAISQEGVALGYQVTSGTTPYRPQQLAHSQATISPLSGCYDGKADLGMFAVWKPTCRDDLCFDTPSNFNFRKPYTVLVFCTSASASGKTGRLQFVWNIEYPTINPAFSPMLSFGSNKDLEEALLLISAFPAVQDNFFHLGRIGSFLKGAASRLGKTVLDAGKGALKGMAFGPKGALLGAIGGAVGSQPEADGGLLSAEMMSKLQEALSRSSALKQ